MECYAACNVQRWNGQLAQLAQTWSDRCEFEHGQPQFDAAAVGYEHLGQNLYVNSDLSAGLRAGVQAWFDEKTDYSYDAVSCAPGRACGHYTQVIRVVIHCCHSHNIPPRRKK